MPDTKPPASEEEKRLAPLLDMLGIARDELPASWAVAVPVMWDASAKVSADVLRAAAADPIALNRLIEEERRAHRAAVVTSA